MVGISGVRHIDFLWKEVPAEGEGAEAVSKCPACRMAGPGRCCRGVRWPAVGGCVCTYVCDRHRHTRTFWVFLSCFSHPTALHVNSSVSFMLQPPNCSGCWGVPHRSPPSEKELVPPVPRAARHTPVLPLGFPLAQEAALPVVTVPPEDSLDSMPAQYRAT